MIVLSGGTGTPKLLRGLVEVMDPLDITVVVNTGEDLFVSGNLVCPDIDSVLYTLSLIIDEEKWWGIRGDTFSTNRRLDQLGCGEVMAIGDLDRATHIMRTNLISGGKTLSMATQIMARSHGISSKIVPMSDDPVRTMIRTQEGLIHFQDFWVVRRGQPEVLAVEIAGIKDARPSPGFIEALCKDDTILIGPSNPVTSIGPIVSLPGIRSMLQKKKVIAISPFSGDGPWSGPAGRFMKACGLQPDDWGVASFYKKLDLFVVSKDSRYDRDCRRLDTFMRDRQDSIRLAEQILELVQCL